MTTAPTLAKRDIQQRENGYWIEETRISLAFYKLFILLKIPSALDSIFIYSASPNYQRRQQAGKSIGSGRMEKGVDLVVGR